MFRTLAAGCFTSGLLLAWWTIAGSHAGAADTIGVDTASYNRACGVDVSKADDRLNVVWPAGEGQQGRLSLRLDPAGPLIGSLGIAASADAPATVLIRDADPVYFLTVGTRVMPRGKPADQTWQVFFDNPARRPHETFQAKLDVQNVRIRSEGNRATVAIDKLTAGKFSGTLELTCYAGSPLVHVEAVLSTTVDRCAILYDAGLAADKPSWHGFAWRDAEGKLQQVQATADDKHQQLAVRHRTLLAQCDGGTLACFPSPHQFFFPVDWSTNNKFAWHGTRHQGQEKRPGFGIRQDETGGGNFVPWFNAPPGTQQRLGVFYLLSADAAEKTLERVLRYTHGDSYPKLDGHLTMTSHWHMAVAETAMRRREKGAEQEVPEFVGMFKQLGVNMVHLAEFHGDGHQFDRGPLRLPEMQTMFSECRRLSDDKLLMIPGEEISKYLGVQQEGKHPGHWMSLFPKPVYFILQRDKGQPFVQEISGYGRVYRVGSREDMMRLVEAEKGLVWAAHPRIKASSWTPDIFHKEDFYLADYWFGGAWKPMPADLSRDRLGQRVLHLLDDMANWGQKKYVIGEVDVFKIDHTHELYAHMNVNYVRMDRLPKFEEGWQPLLDAMRGGEFFVTTGEVLIEDFSVGGKRSGSILSLADDNSPAIEARLRWTFPLRFAEVISGDGQKVYRERIDLTDTREFDRRTLKPRVDLAGRRWVRFEVWDIAGNGAFTQPVWLEQQR